MNITRISATFFSLLVLACGALPAPAQFVFDECAATEAWVPVGDDPPEFPVSAEVVGDELYVLSSDYSSGTGSLSKWNGTRWAKVSTFANTGMIDVDMISFQGSLYLTGGISMIDHLPGTEGLARWDGSRWSAVPGSPFVNGWMGDFHHVRMVAYRGELLVSGDFKREDNLLRRGILAWNGSAWRTIAEWNSPTPNDSAVISDVDIVSFAEWRGDLYVAGRFDAVGGVEAKGVARWNGTEWSGVGTGDMTAASHLFTYQDRLYLFRKNLRQPSQGEEYLTRWDGARWEEVPEIMPARGPQGITALQSSALAVIDDEVHILAWWRFGNGRIGLRWDGSKWERVPVMNSLVYSLTPYKGELYAIGMFTTSCNVPMKGFARLCRSGGCAGISGRVIEDPSGDCEDKTGKKGVPGRLVELLPGPHYAVTDADGHYRFPADAGSYTVRLIPESHWRQTCPSEENRRTVIVEERYSTGNNFAVEPWPREIDLAVSLGGGRARPGGKFFYTIVCTNRGAADVNSSVLRLTYNGVLEIAGINPVPSRAGAGSVEWRLSNMRIGERRTFRVHLSVPTTAIPGVGLPAVARITVAGDMALADNLDSVFTRVTASYDPNDLAVHPAGQGNQGEITRRDEVLTYTVRFQNTGSDTAFRVVVFDTLSPHLDLTSLRLGASSHPFQLRIGEKGALIFDFDEIGLPHMESDEAGSQGFIKYALRLQPNLPAQTRIPNRASIYFDYNLPIHTNSVLTTIAEPADVAAENSEGGTGVKLFPNPVHGMLYVRGPIVPGSIIEISNMLGERVMTTRYGEAGDAKIDLSGLPPGRYLVALRTRAGRESQTVLVVR